MLPAHLTGCTTQEWIRGRRFCVASPAAGERVGSWEASSVRRAGPERAAQGGGRWGREAREGREGGREGREVREGRRCHEETGWTAGWTDCASWPASSRASTARTPAIAVHVAHRALPLRLRLRLHPPPQHPFRVRRPSLATGGPLACGAHGCSASTLPILCALPLTHPFDACRDAGL